MMLVPPLEAPSIQLKPMTDLVVTAGSLVGESGASGTNTITP